MIGPGLCTDAGVTWGTGFCLAVTNAVVVVSASVGWMVGEVVTAVNRSAVEFEKKYFRQWKQNFTTDAEKPEWPTLPLQDQENQEEFSP